MIVVDCNIVVYAHFPNPLREVARRLRSIGRQWVVPPLFRSEFTNVLVQHVRRNLVTAAHAISLTQAMETSLGLQVYPIEPAKVLALALDSGCTAYDCEYVALARALAVPLVTTDRQILEAFPRVAVSLAEYVRRA